MSRQQFGFLIGFLIVTVWAIAGAGAAVVAVVIGVVGWLIGRIFDGDVDVADFIGRFSSSNKRTR